MHATSTPPQLPAERSLPPAPAPPAALADGSIALPVRLSIPVAMAYLPLGLAFGVLVVTSGISWYWAPLSALLIFAGSIEFLAVSLITSGVSVAQVALTALAVNFRHIFYGLTFPLHRLRGRVPRAYGVFALTDETYGITSAGVGAAMTGTQITTLQLVSHLWWAGGALLGALLGQVIPSDIKGFGFALTAMFLILAVDAVRARRDAGLVALALAASLVALLCERYVYDQSFIVVGLLTYLSALSAMYRLEARARGR